MRSPLRIIFLFFTLFVCSSVHAQLQLKNRSIELTSNVSSFNYLQWANRNNNADGKIFCILYFGHPITEEQKIQLSTAGVELFEYVPDNAYTAVITKNIASSFLVKQNVLSVFELDTADKLSPRLLHHNIPAWAIKQPSTVDVIVHFSKGISSAETKERLLQQQFSVIDTSWASYNFITLRIEQQKINDLASLPFIEYIEPVAPDPKTFNYLMRSNTRTNVLNALVSEGGEGLLGKGVTIGIGDDADPSAHIDLYDRVINRAAGIQQTHGTHVAGIAAGGGIKDPVFQGVAPQATIVSQLFNGIFLNAAAYITDYRMVVTNNSWGNITGECDLTGVYDTYSKLMDDIAVQFPYLLNVFAAGNDGPFNCQGFPQQYHTIVSGHQSAKNVLSVGWGEKNITVSASSSIGPTADGRMKPEITSQGSGVRSTAPVNDYFTDWGTSMAAPSVAGGAALLVEKYRLMNSGTDPKSGLIKALLMNGARDIENTAPDNRSGYGFLNLVRSIDMLKNNRYNISSVANGVTNTHTINVPAGTAQLKVMIYWHDPSAALFAQKTLVNDLDISLTTPSAANFLPWKLNSDTNNVTTAAVRAADHLNNSEQITIDDPAAGNYVINVKGAAINAGTPQEYFIVYDLVPTGVDLTYPSVGEPLVPGESIVIQWDAWGQPNNDFTLQFSSDNGASWSNINTVIPANQRQYAWNVPHIATSEGKIRLLRNGTSQSDISGAFVMIGQPDVSLSPVQCDGRIGIQWTTAGGATDYEVMIKQGTEMVPVATTTGTNYVFNGLNIDSTYWVTVRARKNGKPGRRAIAVSRRPNDGTCVGSISDNDLKLDSIINPLVGRKFTSTEIISTNLSIRIKNLDDAPVNNFTVQYSINGSAFVSQNIAAIIPANGTYIHNFTGLNFAAPGNYNVTVVVKNAITDPNTFNDTFKTTIRQLPNSPVVFPVTDNFDAAPAFEITKDIIGLPALDRWDFINTNDSGRIRSFVNTGIARSGNRAMTLDTKQYTISGNTNYLIATYNMGGAGVIFPDELGLKLEFSYKHHGQTPHPDNRVWARKSDVSPWIQVFNFDSIPLRAGEWKTVLIDLSKTAAALSPTSSFQIRFGQHGNLSMGDDIANNGITIDDISLLTAPYDFQLTSIDVPAIHGCDMGAVVPLTIRIGTSKSPPVCLPVKYQLDNGPIVSECAPTGAINYTFNTKLNLSSYGQHALSVWIDSPDDTYKKNDSIKNFIIYNKPIVTKFPHLENFENGPGNWHTEGYKTSWEFGKPSSYKIKTAASGSKAWKTKLIGQYNENELSYLYSPCYEISNLSSPMLSFSMALDIEQCGVFACDRAWMEYSVDGKTWVKLGSYNSGLNWYNNKTDNVWDSAAFTNWHTTGIALPKTSVIQLRFVLQSDAGVTREGVAIDDIQIYDKQMAANADWQVYPNPTRNNLQIISIHETGAKVNLQLFDILGRSVLEKRFTASGFLDKKELTLSMLASGVYALKISDGINSKVYRIVKQ